MNSSSMLGLISAGFNTAQLRYNTQFPRGYERRVRRRRRTRWDRGGRGACVQQLLWAWKTGLANTVYFIPDRADATKQRVSKL